MKDESVVKELRRVVDKAERAESYAVKLDLLFVGCKNLIKDLERVHEPVKDWKSGKM